PRTAMNSRRLMSDIGLPPALAPPVSLPHVQPAAEGQASPWGGPVVLNRGGVGTRRGRRLPHCGITIPLCPLWVIGDREGRSRTIAHVRFDPKTTIANQNVIRSLCAKSRSDAPQQTPCTDYYSMTSFASASNLSGTVRPSALAVVRLMTRSNLVGCSTGRSAGFAPRRILSTKLAARPHMCGQSGP